MMILRRLLIFSCVACLLAPQAFAKDDVVAVLSSDIKPYQEALEAFQKVLKSPVRVVHLASGAAKVEGEPRVLMTFGGKATLAKLSDNSVLVYCMAPGTRLRPGDRGGQSAEISMMPPPDVTLTRLKMIQPKLKRLAVLWASDTNELYASDLSKAARDRGIDVQAEKIKDSAALPARLRDLENHTDAIWVPSDPLLVNEQNLILVAQFSESTHIPFYSSIGGLTKKGAVATISASYADIGETAGSVVQQILAGSSVPPAVYVQKAEVTVNDQAAESAGLTVAPTPSEGSTP